MDQNELRQAFGCFTTGVAIVTTSSEDFEPVGLTINSFTSLSLEPPLLMWGISKNAPSIEAFKYRRLFEVNVLSSYQKDLLKKFSTPSNDKFNDVNWEMSDNKLPKIKECVANFECVIHSIFPGGDHEIIVGKITNFSFNDRPPLILSRGGIIN